jgi:hypothetical protein
VLPVRYEMDLNNNVNGGDATLPTDRLHYKLQTCPLVREGIPKPRANQLSGKRKGKENLVMGPEGVPDTKKDKATDRRS